MRITRSKLAKARMKAGFLRAQDVAPLLGVSRLHLLAVERGKGASPELLAKMSEVYKLELEQVQEFHRLMKVDQAQRSLEAALSD